MKTTRIIFFLLTFCLSIEAFAIVANPNVIQVFAQDSTLVTINLHGDEYCKFATTQDGYTLLQRDNIWYYATRNEQGETLCSNIQLLNHSKLNQEDSDFLKGLPIGIIPQRILNFNFVSSPSNSNRISSTKSPVIGDRRVLVILMAFADYEFTKSLSDFEELFNSREYTKDGANGSVNDYYRSVSYNKLNLKGDIIGPFIASNEMSFYGGNNGDGGSDNNPYALFLEAIDYAKDVVNLKDYDINGDGYIDNVHIIFAGYGEESGASSNTIWSHKMTFPDITVDGVLIDGYSCSPELRGNMGAGITRIGPICHEIGHALGAADYYDTNYASEGQYLGTGKWDIMATGSWNDNGASPAPFNPYVKVYDFGWTNAIDISDGQRVTIESSITEGEIYKIETGITGDFYLLENHNREGYMCQEPGEGLLIFHIGPDLKSKTYTNKINSSYPQQCYIVCASSTEQKPSLDANSYGDINSDGCPYPGSTNNHRFSGNTTPATIALNGSILNITIEDISYDGDVVSFMYYGDNIEPPIDPDTPEIKNIIWYEDFEYGTFLRTWDIINEKNNGNLEIVSVVNTNDTPSFPLAFSGKGYAILYSNEMTLLGNERTIISLSSEDIKLHTDSTYCLSFRARKINENRESNDSITIEDITGGKCVFDITEKESWKEYVFYIKGHNSDYNFVFTCNIQEGTKMFLDDIKIALVTSSNVQLPIYKYNNNLEYDLSGKVSHIGNGIIVVKGKKYFSGKHTKRYRKLYEM